MQAIFHSRLSWLLSALPVLAVWRSRRSAPRTALRLFCAALSVAAPSALAAAPPQDPAPLAIHASSSFAFADLDGDRQPDLATAEIERSDAHLTRYLIRLRFTSGAPPSAQSIGVIGAFGLPRISALDVNGDHLLDLVITAGPQQRPIAVLLNDGRGSFSLANPREFPSALVDGHLRWDPAAGHLQDIAVLMLARTPQAGAGNAVHSFVPAHFAACPILARLAPPLDRIHLSTRDRAPPLSV